MGSLTTIPITVILKGIVYENKKSNINNILYISNSFYTNLCWSRINAKYIFI